MSSPLDPDPLLNDAEARKDLYQRAVKLWGADAQWAMVQEECCELALAVHRVNRGRSTLFEIAEEVADVEIMLEQARLMLGNKMVDAHKEAKLNRLRNRIEEAEEMASA